MIVRNEDAEKRNFLGVDFLLLAHGEKTMVTKMQFKAEDKIPFHKHPHEQCGYVLSGKYILFVGKDESNISAGDTYNIPGNIEHRVEIIEPGEVLDFFSPPREDYL